MSLDSQLFCHFSKWDFGSSKKTTNKHKKTHLPRVKEKCNLNKTHYEISRAASTVGQYNRPNLVLLPFLSIADPPRLQLSDYKMKIHVTACALCVSSEQPFEHG